MEHVAVEHDTEGTAHFPLSRWLPANQPMHFTKFDSELPQIVKANDPALYEQRAKELEQKKKDFACAPLTNMTGMPRSVNCFFLWILFKFHKKSRARMCVPAASTQVVSTL